MLKTVSEKNLVSNHWSQMNSGLMKEKPQNSSWAIFLLINFLGIGWSEHL
jgi:hypothetical protein